MAEIKFIDNLDHTCTVVHPDGIKMTFTHGDLLNSQRVEVWEELKEQPDALQLARLAKEIGDYLAQNHPEKIR